VLQAAAPARLIDGGSPTDATVAQVLVSKYGLPSSVVSPGADLRAAGHQSRPINAGRLGGFAGILQVDG
jgi:hypothetical protein